MCTSPVLSPSICTMSMREILGVLSSLALYIYKVVLILVPHHFLAFHCLTLPDLATVQLVVLLELHPLAVPMCPLSRGVKTLHLALPLTPLHALLLLGHLLLHLNALMFNSSLASLTSSYSPCLHSRQTSSSASLASSYSPSPTSFHSP